MNINIDLLLEDWAYRCKSGYPTKTNPLDISVLKEVLFEHGATADEILEYVKLLSEKPTAKKPPIKQGNSPAAEARKKGLEHYGKGTYGPPKKSEDDETPPTHETVDGKLVPIKKKDSSDTNQDSDSQDVAKNLGGKKTMQVGPEIEAEKKAEKEKSNKQSIKPTPTKLGDVEEENINYVTKALPAKFKPTILKIKNNVNIILSKTSSKEEKLVALQDLLDKSLISINTPGGGNLKLLVNYKNIIGKTGDTGKEQRLKYILMSSKGGSKLNAKTAANAVFAFAKENNIEIPVYGQKAGSAPQMAKSAAIFKKLAIKSAETHDREPDYKVKTQPLPNGHGFSIGSSKFKPLPLINSKTKKTLLEVQTLIVEQYKKDGLDAKQAEKKVKLVEKSVKKYNTSIKAFELAFKEGSFVALYNDSGKIIDQSTPKGRAEAKKAVINIMAEQITPFSKEISDRYKELVGKVDSLSPEEFLKETKQIELESYNNSVTRPAASSLAESITGLIKLNEGSQVYFPFMANFKLADLLALREVTDLNDIKDPSKLAKSAQMLFTSLEKTSIKFGLGGASAAQSKIENSEFNNVDVGPELVELTSKAHKNIFKNYSTTACKQYQTQAHKLIEKYNLKDINLKELDKRIERTITTQMPQFFAKKGAPEQTKAEINTFKERIKTYMLLEQVIEKTHNKFIESQNYGNVSHYITEQDGKAVNIEYKESNGITTLCLMKMKGLFKDGEPSNFASNLINTPVDEVRKKQTEIK